VLSRGIASGIYEVNGAKSQIDRILDANIGDFWFEHTCSAARRGPIVPGSERTIPLRAPYQRLSDLGRNGGSGVDSLATRDSDFDHISDIQIYKPTDI
jgi:hypothetical protein